MGVLFTVLTRDRAGFFAIAVRHGVFQEGEDRLVHGVRREATVYGRFLIFLHEALQARRVVERLQLPRHVRGSSVGQVKVVSPLVVRKVPRAASRILSKDSVRCVVTHVFVVKIYVSLHLCRRQRFSPSAIRAAQEVVQVPIVRVVSPFPNGMAGVKVRDLHVGNPSSPRCQVDRVSQGVFISAYHGVATNVAV